MVNATYVGSDECRKCHERVFSNWKDTLHAKMIQDVKKNPTVVVGDFDSPSAPKNLKKEDIVYTIGSEWRQRYLTKKGDEYIVHTSQYNVGVGKWEESTKNGSWFKDCAGCHATGVDPVKKTFKEASVGCEMCHGAGSNHAKAELGYESATIINPAKLTPRAAANICGACHSTGTDKSGKYPYPVNYKVSKVANLKLFFNLSSPEKNPDRFWPSKDSRHAYQQFIDWERSEHAKAGVTCYTCHSSHEKDALSFQTKKSGDELCKGCHKAIDVQPKAAHAIHTFGSCIACHMPRTVKESMYAVDERSHTFKFAGPDASFKHGGVNNQPNSCSGCHYHKDTPLAELMGAWSSMKQKSTPKSVEIEKGVK
ncbi:MAG: hypothetical protein HY099_01305 [Nitrospirae bacterium]|nr:hypothetical protein [Nitrospirota bacterium]